MTILAIFCAFSFIGFSNALALDQALQDALSSIGNAQLQICLPAIESLGRSKNALVIKPMSDALAQENRPLVRRYIVDALGNLRNRASLPALKLALQDTDVQVRQSAVAALGLLSSSDMESALIEQAGSEKDPAVKKQLIHHLGFASSEQARQALVSFKSDADPTVSRMAAQTLASQKAKEGK